LKPNSVLHDCKSNLEEVNSFEGRRGERAREKSKKMNCTANAERFKSDHVHDTCSNVIRSHSGSAASEQCRYEALIALMGHDWNV
jgi:hypothetical protein